MDFNRIGRIPKRIGDDLQTVFLAKNWFEILSSKVNRSTIQSVRLRNGIVINTPDQVSLDFLFQEIWIDKVYSPEGYEINDNDVIFDIGGNIGVFALYATTQAKNVEIYSYEPFPSNADFFERNLKASKLENIHLFNMAVSDKTGVRILNVHDSWIKHSLNDKESKAEGIKVNCISLDDALKDFSICNMLKLDCEGSEYEILYDCLMETMGKVEKIVGEYHNLDDDLRNGKKLKVFLEENNYQVDVFHPLDDNSGFICARKRN